MILSPVRESPALAFPLAQSMPLVPPSKLGRRQFRPVNQFLFAILIQFKTSATLAKFIQIQNLV
jgi:hypothetical protein